MALRRTLAPICLVTLLIAGAFALAPGASTVSSAEAKIAFGISDWGVLRGADFGPLGRNRVRVYRTPLDWDRIETSPGVYDFRGTDSIVREAAANKVRILPILFGSPSFIRSSRKFPPRGAANLDSWSRYVAATAARYGRNGSFWRENPQVSFLPPRYWQVWNEEHLRFFWGTRPNTAEYLTLARRARTAVRSQDGAALIMTGSVTQSNGAKRYLGRLFRKRGSRGTFDAVALNLYHKALRSPRQLRATARSFRRYLSRRGIGKSLHVTEFGWRSSGSRRSRRTQANRVRSSVRFLLRDTRRLKLRTLIYFSYRDAPFTGGFRPSFRTGLRTLANRRKPAYFTYLKLAKRHGNASGR